MRLTHITRFAVLGFAAAALAAVSSACAAPEKPAAEHAAASSGAPERIEPVYDRTGRLQKLQYDRNNDGRIDTWGYMDGTRVVKVEVDENGDGTVDRWEFHRSESGGDAATAVASGAAPGVDVTLERIERATRFDGRVSRREFFDAGVLTKTEEDTDGDGAIDKWETYVDGSLSLMSLDTQRRGTPDRRLVYRADGSLDRLEADASGSGLFQTIAP